MTSSDAKAAIVSALESSLERAKSHDDLLSDSTTTRDTSDCIDAGDAALIVRRLTDAIPDASWTIESVLFDSELVLCHAAMCGTYTRAYLGHAPTLQRVVLRAAFVARLADTTRGPQCRWYCALDDVVLRTSVL